MPKLEKLAHLNDGVSSQFNLNLKMYHFGRIKPRLRAFLIGSLIFLQTLKGNSLKRRFDDRIIYIAENPS